MHHFGKFLLILNWEGAYIRPQISTRKIPVSMMATVTAILNSSKFLKVISNQTLSYFIIWRRVWEWNNAMQ